MLPIETPSLQNIALSNGNQPSMCLLPSNLNKHISSKQYHRRNANHHIPSRLIHEYIAPFRSECDINNQMVPFGYYLHLGQYENENNGNLHRVPPVSGSLNLPYTSLESDVSTTTFNGSSMTPTAAKIQLSEFNQSLNRQPRPTYSTQKTEYENLIQPCSATYHQHTLTPSFSLSTPSLSSVPTSVVPPARIKQKYTRRLYRSPVEQQLSQYPNTSIEPIFPNCWSSLPLPSMADTLTRPNECTFPVDLVRTSNFVPLSLPDSPISSDSPSTIVDNKGNSRTIQQRSLPYSMTNTLERHQTFGQYLSDQKCNHMQKINNRCSTNNLAYNLPYFLTAPYEHYYLFPSHPMPINMPSGRCSTLLPELNTTLSPLSFENNMKKVREKQDDSQKSKVVQNHPVEEQMDEKKIPILRRRLQKKSKIKDRRIKALIKRIEQRNKSAILKFMIRKRKKQQPTSKRKLPELKIEKVDSNVSKPTKMETKLPDIIASSLKITFNTAQNIESISLYYHQRHKHEIKTNSNTTNNKLGLLIEAVNFIEMYNDTSKLTLQSIE